jgi:hypothetical protein
VRRGYWTLFLLLNPALVSTCGAQKPPDVSGLVAELNQPRTTDRATRALWEACSKDPNIRQYVVEKLPGMIDKPKSDEIWLNAVRLAGRLKASEAVPSLQRAFTSTEERSRHY